MLCYSVSTPRRRGKRHLSGWLDVFDAMMLPDFPEIDESATPHANGEPRRSRTPRWRLLAGAPVYGGS